MNLIPECPSRRDDAKWSASSLTGAKVVARKRFEIIEGVFDK